MTELLAPYAMIEPRDAWMPRGLEQPEEAKLGESTEFLPEDRRERLMSWWLAVRAKANTPNWDIACTGTIEGQRGLILMEAKAHDAELLREEHGKQKRNEKNHHQIGEAISEANTRLNDICPGWDLSRDSHYQLANRFAWAWKVASLGMPVILIYLGFLEAEEMRDQGVPFANAINWEQAVRNHAEDIVPTEAWGKALRVGGVPFRALIHAIRLDIPLGEVQAKPVEL